MVKPEPEPLILSVKSKEKEEKNDENQSTKSSFKKEGENSPWMMNPRKTMPNLVPTAMEFRMLQRRKTESSVDGYSPQMNEPRDFETIIKKISGILRKMSIICRIIACCGRIAAN